MYLCQFFLQLLTVLLRAQIKSCSTLNFFQSRALAGIFSVQGNYINNFTKTGGSSEEDSLPALSSLSPTSSSTVSSIEASDTSLTSQTSSVPEAATPNLHTGGKREGRVGLFREPTDSRRKQQHSQQNISVGKN